MMLLVFFSFLLFFLFCEVSIKDEIVILFSCGIVTKVFGGVYDSVFKASKILTVPVKTLCLGTLGGAKIDFLPEIL